MIWYKYLLLFKRVFQKFLEDILTHNFLGIEVGLKLFFICTLEMVVGSLWKQGTYITVAVGDPIERKLLAR